MSSNLQLITLSACGEGNSSPCNRYQGEVGILVLPISVENQFESKKPILNLVDPPIKG